MMLITIVVILHGNRTHPSGNRMSRELYGLNLDDAIRAISPILATSSICATTPFYASVVMVTFAVPESIHCCAREKWKSVQFSLSYVQRYKWCALSASNAPVSIGDPGTMHQ